MNWYMNLRWLSALAIVIVTAKDDNDITLLSPNADTAIELIENQNYTTVEAVKKVFRVHWRNDSLIFNSDQWNDARHYRTVVEAIDVCTCFTTGWSLGLNGLTGFNGFDPDINDHSKQIEMTRFERCNEIVNLYKHINAYIQLGFQTNFGKITNNDIYPCAFNLIEKRIKNKTGTTFDVFHEIAKQYCQIDDLQIESYKYDFIGVKHIDDHMDDWPNFKESLFLIYAFDAMPEKYKRLTCLDFENHRLTKSDPYVIGTGIKAIPRPINDFLFVSYVIGIRNLFINGIATKLRRGDQQSFKFLDFINDSNMPSYYFETLAKDACKQPEKNIVIFKYLWEKQTIVSKQLLFEIWNYDCETNPLIGAIIFGNYDLVKYMIEVVHIDPTTTMDYAHSFGKKNAIQLAIERHKKLPRDPYYDGHHNIGRYMEILTKKYCSICLEQQSGSPDSDTASDEWDQTKCNHHFHKKCLQQLKDFGHSDCPLCRNPLE